MVEVSFPNLSSHVFYLSKTLPFSPFGISIAWYGAIIVCGIIIAAIYGFTQCNRFGITRSTVLEYLLYGIPMCYVGARLYYVIYQWDYYSQNPLEILNLKGGGLAIYGAVLAGALSVVLYFHFTKGDILRALDLGSICILIGQVIGRWGNFINGEAHGYATSLPWGMSIDGASPVHPTFLYESLWNFVLLLLMHYRSKHPAFRGEVMLWYIFGYGLGRTWIEGLRTDSLYLWGTSIRVSQLLALLSSSIVFCILLYFYITHKYPKPFVPPVSPAKAAPVHHKKKKRK